MITLKDAARWCGGKVLPEYENVAFEGANNDSRRLTPGQLFVALRAERDGHDFIPAALEKGAAAVLGIVSHRLSNFLAALPLTLMIGITSFFPLIYNHSFNKKMRTGVFFEGKSDGEIIDAAKEYVDQYRAWEEKQQARENRRK